MKSRTLWITVCVLAGLILAGGVVGALPDAPEADVAAEINYQGRLTNAAGAPLSGTFTMRFQIYSAATGGTLWWDSGNLSVPVVNGLFNVVLGVNPRNFNGGELWLRIYVDGEWLTPRQELLPVPYALGLRPGADITGQPDPSGYVLRVMMTGVHATRAAVWAATSTGDAVRGASPGGYGLAGYTDDGYAVYGQDGGSTTAHGYGGYFSSLNGIGVYGVSSATPHFTNMHAPGVYGKSANGVGVYGTGRTGVRGESVAAGSGVYGRTDAGDLYNTAGVWGTAGGSQGIGVRGYRVGIGAGVQGTTYGASSGSGVIGESESFIGVWGESDADFGMWAQTGLASNNYGLYTPDNIYSLNYHLAGALMQLVQNGGAEPLDPGDVAVFSGMTAALQAGGPPVAQVARATTAGSTAVAGVVYSRFNIATVTRERQAMGGDLAGDQEVTLAGPVLPGEYLLLVIQGPALVKVDAAAGALQPGDLLGSAALTAHAGRAPQVTVAGTPSAVPGTVLGKALEHWDGGQGQIYVFVTLQ